MYKMQHKHQQEMMKQIISVNRVWTIKARDAMLQLEA